MNDWRVTELVSSQDSKQTVSLLYLVSEVLREAELAQEPWGLQACLCNPITLLVWGFFVLNIGIIRTYSELKLTPNFKPVIIALEEFCKESSYSITWRVPS